MDPLAHHTTLWRENDEATPVYEAVAGVKDIGEQTQSREMGDDTEYGLTNNSKKAYAGIIDNGSQDFVFAYRKGDAGQQLIRDDFNSGEERNYQIRINDTEKTATVMKAIVSSIGRTFTKGEKVMQKVTLTINEITDETWT